MHEKVLSEKSKTLLAKLKKQNDPALRDWILAGGTGLALLVGHRISDDFDFFRNKNMDIDSLHNLFKKTGIYETLQQGENTLTILTHEVKISFFQVPAPFIFKPSPYIFFSIADIRDIALMKLIAISGRGSRKDFIDLYTILRGGDILNDYFKMLPKKYSKERINYYHILKSLTFFEDAEKEPMPKMLEPFNWEECKAFFTRQAHNIVLPS